MAMTTSHEVFSIVEENGLSCYTDLLLFCAIYSRTNLWNHFMLSLCFTNLLGSWSALAQRDIYSILVMVFLWRHQRMQLLISLTSQGDWAMTPLRTMQQNRLLFIDNQLNLKKTSFCSISRCRPSNVMLTKWVDIGDSFWLATNYQHSGEW